MMHMPVGVCWHHMCMCMHRTFRRQLGGGRASLFAPFRHWHTWRPPGFPALACALMDLPMALVPRLELASLLHSRSARARPWPAHIAIRIRVAGAPWAFAKLKRRRSSRHMHMQIQGGRRFRRPHAAAVGSAMAVLRAPPPSGARAALPGNCVYTPVPFS